MVEDAEGPDEKAGTACDRVLVIPATGSDLELGQGFLAFFFFAAAILLLDSPLAPCPEGGSCEEADTVDADEDDAMEEEELDR